MRLHAILPICSLLTACGVAPHSAAPAPAPVHASSSQAGCYLAIVIAPTPEIEDAESRLRTSIGFLDLGNAVPPRDPHQLHVTVGYFRSLDSRDAEVLAEEFRGKNVTGVLDGWGVANRQAAYFTLQGLDEPRRYLQGHHISYSADDPHVTFGVSPENPHDVHGVPKKAQQTVGPFKFLGAYHLMQGEKTVW